MILIVDDTPENLFSLKSLLQLHAYDVDTASSGEEALKRILKNEYELAILDVQMPGMDGYEVAEAITGYSKSKDIPIIFLSAVNVDKRFVTKGYASGGVDYVTKPFDPDLLLLKVKTFVRLYRQTRELNEMKNNLEKRVAERTAELLTANEALELSNTELQQFASLASHDLQEPLRKIITFGGLIQERYLAQNEEAGVYMKKIMNASGRMRDLIDDLLNYSKLSFTPPFVPTDLNALLQETLADLEVAIKEKSARIDAEPLPVAEVVPGQMRQVFQNLVSNALKFSGEGTPPLVKIAAQTLSGNRLRISVADNGIGFDEAYLDKIFVLFQRLHGRKEYAGTGIGLAIVKKIMDRHGGSVTAHSQPGKGATFVLELPLSHSAAHKA